MAYVDSSAVLKLLVQESETSRLEAYLADCDGLVVSRLATVECRRAINRAGGKRMLQHFDQVLESLYLVDLTVPILDHAAALRPRLLRSLDAIHLATALSIGDPHLAVVTYDTRLADAARANQLRVVRP